MMNEQKINDWLAEVTKWWDDNEVGANTDDPEGDVMYDAFSFIEEIIELSKESKESNE